MNIVKNSKRLVLSTIALAITLMGGILLVNKTYADGEDVTINFNDINMCNAVASEVGMEGNCSDSTPNITMNQSDINDVTELYLGGREISDITGIESFKNLTYLYLSTNQISNLAPLSELTNLVELYLGENHISNLTPLSKLTNLTTLKLGNNSFCDIIPLYSLEKLEDVPFFGDGPLISACSVTTNNKEYGMPSLFLLLNDSLGVEPAAYWINDFLQENVRPAIEDGTLEFKFKNAVMNADGKSITITDVTKPVIINVDLYLEGEVFTLASLTITYEGSPEPEPVPTPDDPAVPDTGKNTKESSAAILTATLCIISGIVLTAIPMTYIYRKNKE